jgi:hypothetical protein
LQYGGCIVNPQQLYSINLLHYSELKEYYFRHIANTSTLAATAIGYTMKLFIATLLFGLTYSSYGQTKNPFLSLKFDKVAIYDFEGGKGEQDFYIVDEKGQLAKSIRKQVQLDKSTINTLNTKLGDKKSYGGGTAACFDPHLGIVYFLKDKIVAHISVCLDCNRLRSSIDIQAQKQGKVGTGNNAYYLSDGLSKSFRHYLNDILKKYSFSHQIK